MYQTMPSQVAQKTCREALDAAVGRLCHTRSVHPSSTAADPRSTRVLDRLCLPSDRAERLRHVEVLPARPAVSQDWPSWAADDVVAAFVRVGIERPWRHQRSAADAAHAGRHVVLATGTASGKSLAYQLPALTAIRHGRGPHAQRGASVLYLAPTKALAHDQRAALLALGLDVRVTTHDGDSSREERDWSRDFGEYVLTNPDMLHRLDAARAPQVGVVLVLPATTSWSTSATTTAACSALT